MKKHTFVVLTNATDERHDEFNTWYNERHIPDVLAVPGFVAAQRFRLAGAQPGGRTDAPWKYLALYEIETDDLKGTLDALSARAGTDAMVISETLDTSTTGAFVFEPIAARVTEQQAAAARR